MSDHPYKGKWIALSPTLQVGFDDEGKPGFRTPEKMPELSAMMEQLIQGREIRLQQLGLIQAFLVASSGEQEKRIVPPPPGLKL